MRSMQITTSKRRKLLSAILGITFITLLPVLANSFLVWDDNEYVTSNPLIKNLTLENIQGIMSTPVQGNYHPVTILSLALNYSLSGLNPFSYYATNLILHLLNTALVFGFIMSISERNLRIAAVTALLFGIHPMHVESVAWMAERKDLLYTCFLFASLTSFVRYIQKRKKSAYCTSFLLFILSLASKPAAVVLPVLLLLLDYLCKRKINIGLVAEKIPFFLCSFLMGILTLNTQFQAGALDMTKSLQIGERVLFASYAYTQYIIKLLFPYNLSAFHPYPSDLSSLSIFLSTVLVIGVIAFVWYQKQNRPILFGILFFTFSIALVLQFISVGEAIIAERYTYVPYVGLFFIIGHIFNQLHSASKNNRTKTLTTGAFITFSLLLAWNAHQRAVLWTDPELLWKDVIQKYQHVSVAHNNLGLHYRSKNKTEQAIREYTLAISSDPLFYQAYINRAEVYLHTNDPDMAIKDTTNAIQINPNKPEAHNNRGLAFLQKKKLQKALTEFNKSIDLNTYYLSGYINRANAYTKTREFRNAIADYNICLSLDPSNPEIYLARGLAKLNIGENKNAIQDINLFLENTPKNGPAHLYRAYAFKDLGEKKKALQDANRAKELGVTVDTRFLDSLQ